MADQDHSSNDTNTESEPPEQLLEEFRKTSRKIRKSLKRRSKKLHETQREIQRGARAKLALIPVPINLGEDINSCVEKLLLARRYQKKFKKEIERLQHLVSQNFGDLPSSSRIDGGAQGPTPNGQSNGQSNGTRSQSTNGAPHSQMDGVSDTGHDTSETDMSASQNDLINGVSDSEDDSGAMTGVTLP